MQGQSLRVMITGSNKGIGYGIIETALANRDKLRRKYKFIMTARDLVKGEAAMANLREKYGPNIPVDLIKLDVSDPGLIEDAIRDLQSRDPIDILINNAGIYVRNAPIDQDAIDVTLDTNYFGPRRLTEQMLQCGLINDGGKVLFMSSLLGKFNSLRVSYPEVYNILKEYQSSEFSLQDLDKMVKRYQHESTIPEKLRQWQHNPYDTSKNFIAIYAYLLAWQPDVLHRDIQVYSLDPGFCDTDLTKGIGAGLTYLQGSTTPMYLVELPRGVNRRLQGGYFIDKHLASL